MTEEEYNEKLSKIERRLIELENYAEDAEEEAESALSNCILLKEHAETSAIK